MEAAYAFMQRLLEYPLAECSETLAAVPDAARAAGVRIEFPAGLKLGSLERVFALRRSLVPRLLAIAEALLRQGLVLKLEDAYRSLDVQRRGACCDFILKGVLAKVRWELNGGEPTAELLQRRIAVLTATTPKFANHMSGSAIDISVLRAADGREFDRGAPYLTLSEVTPMASPFISAEARRNRALVNEVFAAQSFLPYPYEYWHYSHGDADYELVAAAGRPGRFGPVHWDAATGAVRPVEDPFLELLPTAVVRDFLHQVSVCKHPPTCRECPDR